MRSARFVVVLCLAELGCGRIGFHDDAIGADAVDALVPRLTVPKTIDAKSNLWGAGHATPPSVDVGGEGVLPVQIDVPAGTGRYFTITALSGTIQYGPGLDPSTADGKALLGGGLTYDGLSAPRMIPAYSLIAVELDASEPMDPAPPSLIFDTTALTFAGIGLRQMFFVGDGLAATATIQTFEIADSATRLFLGFLDGPVTPPGPGSYDDNTGSIEATITIY